jgi:hypothetical protein
MIKKSHIANYYWQPEGYHSITPYLVVNDASKTIDFYNVHLEIKKLADTMVLTERAL